MRFSIWLNARYAQNSITLLSGSQVASKLLQLNYQDNIKKGIVKYRSSFIA